MKNNRPNKAASLDKFSRIHGKMHPTDQESLSLFGHTAIDAMSQGVGTMSNYDTLCHHFNIARYIVAQGLFDAAYEPLNAAILAIKGVKWRHAQIKKFVFKAQELEAVRTGLIVIDDMYKLIHKIDFDKAIDAYEKRDLKAWAK